MNFGFMLAFAFNAFVHAFQF